MLCISSSVTVCLVSSCPTVCAGATGQAVAGYANAGKSLASYIMIFNRLLGRNTNTSDYTIFLTPAGHRGEPAQEQRVSGQKGWSAAPANGRR